MNKIRKAKIERVMDEIENLKSELEEIEQEEQDYADNMPDNLQDSERHENAITAVEALQEAQCSLEEARNHLEEI
jgi:t-SNARE complex subunit (syntaxin)